MDVEPAADKIRSDVILIRAPAASPRRPARRRRGEAPAGQFQPLREEHPMHPCKSDDVARGEGISRAARDALADPIVQALLVADRIDPRDVADLSRRMAAWFSRREAITARAPGPSSRWDAFESNEHDLVWPKQRGRWVALDSKE
jgi:hypothetical protein